MYKWVGWITNPSSGKYLPNLDWCNALFPGTRKNGCMQDPGIKSCARSVKSLSYLLKKRCNLKVLLVFFPYRWPDEVKAFSVSSNIHRGWKYYQGVIHNTYHGRHIKTDHRIILSMP